MNVCHARDNVRHIVHGGTGTANQKRALSNACHTFVNQFTHLSRSIRTALSLVAQFWSDSGKTTPLFSSTSRFNRSIKRQQVGL